MGKVLPVVDCAPHPETLKPKDPSRISGDQHQCLATKLQALTDAGC